LREERRVVVPVVAGVLEGAASAEPLPFLFAPSWEGGFRAVVELVVEEVGADGEAATGVVVAAASGAVGLGVEGEDEDEEGLGASCLS
jgi:hypothetical protein